MNPLVEKYGDDARWMNWRFEPRKDKKPGMTKIPRNPRGGNGSSTDFRTWATYDYAKKKSENVGIVFKPDKKLLGIDIDHCLEDGKIVHEKKDEILAFLKALDTYTEVSPSGTGLHAYLAISDEDGFTPIANRHQPYEFYVAGRYFTVTEKPFGSKVRKVRTVTAAEAAKLLDITGYPWGAEPEKMAKTTGNSGEKLPLTEGKPISRRRENGPIADGNGDTDILTRMFNAKNGAKVRALYDGDTSGYGKDHSVAEFALLMHLAFWTQKDPIAMERIWLASPLGNRTKTQKRTDYRADSIRKAIDQTTEVYTPTVRGENRKAVKSGKLDLMMRYNKDGEPIGPIVNSENVRRIALFDDHLRENIRFNDFSHMIETKFGPSRKWAQLQTEDIVQIMLHLQRDYSGFERVSKDVVADGIYSASLENTVNPPADYIKSVQWDGVPRIGEWLHHAYGAPLDLLHSAMGANWLKGLVKRVIEPGSKFDYVLILEGGQGLGKSRSFRALGGAWHTEVVITPDNKDFYLVLQDNIIVEFSEGETMSRAETKKLKAVITMQEDEFRKPYGRGNAKYPRHCVFAMTTNAPQYLKDETGNRRYLPIHVERKVDIDWIEQNRDQLFAEAYQKAIVERESTWDFPEEITDLQESRVISQPYEDELVEWYMNKDSYARDQGITALEAYQQVWQAGAPLGREMPPGTSQIIGGMFRRILHLDRRQRRVDGYPKWRWYPSLRTQKDFPVDAQPKFVETID